MLDILSGLAVTRLPENGITHPLPDYLLEVSTQPPHFFKGKVIYLPPLISPFTAHPQTWGRMQGTPRPRPTPYLAITMGDEKGVGPRGSLVSATLSVSYPPTGFRPQTGRHPHLSRWTILAYCQLTCIKPL